MNQPDAKGQWPVLKYVHTHAHKKIGSAKHILIILIPLYCYQNKPTLSLL